MSDQARQWVKQHSQHRGNAKFVLFMIADHCRDGSTGCSPSIETLAAETGLSERHIRRIIDDLAASGELVVYENKGPYGCNLYDLPLVSGSVLPDTMSGRSDAQMSGRNQIDDNLPDILPDTMSGSANSSGHSSGHLCNPPTPPNKVLNSSSLERETRDELLDHPAVTIYREVFARSLNRDQRKQVAERVSDYERWRQKCESWKLNNYSPSNLAGLLDNYERPDPAPRNNGSRNGKPTARLPDQPDLHWAEDANGKYLALADGTPYEAPVYDQSR